MSKTDKTRPYWVKVLDHPALLVEDHDHTDPDRPCDLPQKPMLWRGPRQSRTVCGWSEAPSSWRLTQCGCGMCTMQAERRIERRRERRQGRRYSKGSWREEYTA